MTGLSGSGKTTIAKALENKLVIELGLSVQNLDGDNVRFGLNRDLGFSQGDRAESVRRVSEMACLFSSGGIITLVTLVSPYRNDRDEARKRHEDMKIPFVEVLMDVPIDVVKERDPKGLYAKVATGELKGMTGMSDDAPYEEPLNPEVCLYMFMHVMWLFDCVCWYVSFVCVMVCYGVYVMHIHHQCLCDRSTYMFVILVSCNITPPSLLSPTITNYSLFPYTY